MVDMGNPRAETEERNPRLCCSSRLLVCFGCFVALFNQTYMRVGVSFALVCMVSTPPINHAGTDDCPALLETNEGNELFEFNWSSSLRGHLISGAFYGYICGPFVSGYLSFKYGGKIILMTGMTVAAILYALVPEGTRLHYQIFFGLRVVTGFFSGFIPPAFYDIIGHWTVPKERQYLVAGALLGVPLACILNFPINSFWCTNYGWIWTFYFTTIWLLFCVIVSYFIIYNYPSDSPRISEKERDYVQKYTVIRNPDLTIPWSKIFTSIPIYAYFLTHFCVNYSYLTVILSLPSFMRDIHHVNLRSNGFISAVPFIGSLLGRLVMTLYFEKIRQLLGLSKTTMRKIFVFVGLATLASTLFTVTFLTCKYRYLVLACFTLGQFALEFSLTGGYMLSLMEMCPSYTNVVSGMANAFANVAGLMSPLITGSITIHGKVEEWNTVYYTVIGVLLTAIVVYTLFGSSELQPWDKRQDRLILPRHSDLHS